MVGPGKKKQTGSTPFAPCLRHKPGRLIAVMRGRAVAGNKMRHARLGDNLGEQAVATDLLNPILKERYTGKARIDDERRCTR